MVMLFGFVIVVLIVVAVHEYGHYAVARMCGIHVEQFSLGFGKPLYTKLGSNRFKFVIGWIPLGGYIKIRDEYEYLADNGTVLKGLKAATVMQRIAVLLAGPAANLVFAVMVFSGLSGLPHNVLKPTIGAVSAGGAFAKAGLGAGDVVTQVGSASVFTREQMVGAIVDEAGVDFVTVIARSDNGVGENRSVDVKIGGPIARNTPIQNVPELLGFTFWMPVIPPVIGAIQQDSSAAKAGLLVGDRILAIDDQALTVFADLSRYVSQRPNQRMTFTYQRDGVTHATELTSGSTVVDGQTVGRVGVAASSDFDVDQNQYQRYQPGVVEAFRAGYARTYSMISGSLNSMRNIVTGKESVKSMSGTVGLVQFSGEAVKRGLTTFVTFIALISISVGVFNLLPVPGLDGGQVCFQIIDAAAGGRAANFYFKYAIRAGVAFVIALFVITLYNDLSRIFPIY